MTSAFEHLAAGGPLDSIIQERRRQDAKWGADRILPMELWMTILAEEHGELAEAILETAFNARHPKAGRSNIRKEAVQVAAVAVALIEQLDREVVQENYRHAMEEGQI